MQTNMTHEALETFVDWLIILQQENIIHNIN